MKVANIADMKGGWFVGNFEPSVLKTGDFEVAHHHYKRGVTSDPHTHKLAVEINYILKGKAIVSGTTLETGDIFIYEPNDVADVRFLEDTDLVIVKAPSVPEDKYSV